MAGPQPLQNLLNLLVKTDNSGNLAVSGQTFTSPDSPAQKAGNVRGCVDSNNQLQVVFK